MPWDRELHDPPAFGDRARFFVSLKMSRDDADAVKLAEQMGILQEDLEKFASVSGCSLAEATRGIAIALALREKLAAGEKLASSQHQLMSEVEKVAAAINLSQYKAPAIGAAIGAALLGMRGYSGNRPDATGTSSRQRLADHRLQEFELKEKSMLPKERAGYLHQLSKSLLTLDKSLADAGKDHPVAAAALDALVGAGVGASTGIRVQKLKTEMFPKHAI